LLVLVIFVVADVEDELFSTKHGCVGRTCSRVSEM
jgi:hypothetical protein